MAEIVVRRAVRFWILLLLCLPFAVFAQNPFREAAPSPVETWADGRPLPRSFRAWHLDRDLLLHLLAETPDRFEQPQRPGLSLRLPDARGVTRRFLVWSSPVLAPELAARYPGIRTWFGVDADFPARRLLLDHGPKGLHAMITCPGEPDQFLDPWDRHHGGGPLIAYARKDLPHAGQDPFHCLTAPSEDHEPEDPANRSLASDNHLRTYRLALACTGEYGTFHGGTIVTVLAAMATTLHRVNGIYERDFGIRLELVADNDQLVFLNPATDPFDNGDIGTMLSANQLLCDNVIGSTNYDIGHVFGTSGGGQATLFGPCNPNTKARAATGLSNPAGDPFDVDYVAHEIGHQFGGNHTFNNSCSGNRNNATAWEPGSGSTIMAYAGVCTPNVQSVSDAYFHGGSQAEIRQFTVNGNGNTCPQLFLSGNQAPQVYAGPDRVIPHSTPFVLEALASDPDGDLLSYCWEQFNPQIGTMPPMETNAQGPLFRSLAPDTTPYRIFPALSAILQNQSPTWEVLPAVARSLQCRVTVRDNHPLHGRWAQDAVQLTVSGTAGPFRVTQPNTALTWLVGDTVTVAWEVAGTDLPPVNSPLVDIALSTDGGFTYPILLGQALPNTGLAAIPVPWVSSEQCRVRVQGHAHIFFDLSDEPFAIREPDQPSFLARGFPEATSLCSDAGDSSLLHIALHPLGGMTDTLHLSWTGPQGLHADLPGVFFLDQTDTLAFRIWFDGQPDPSTEPLEVLLQSGAGERRLRFDLSLFARPMDPARPLLPEDGQDSLALDVQFRWSSVPEATVYRLELASSPGFGSSVFQVVETADTMLILALSPSRIVYWRVWAGNPCGLAGEAVSRVFRTLPENCRQYLPEGLPIAIPDGSIFTANSLVDVPDAGRLTRVEADIDLAHGNLGQITLRLSEPGGLSRNLVNKACPGQAHIQARFSDAGQPIVCSGLPPAIQGLVRAQAGPLDLFEGLDAEGAWTLRIIDDQILTGGQLNAWSLHLCTSPPLIRFPDRDPDTLQVPYLGDAPLDPIWMTDAHLRFLLRRLPEHGYLERDGAALGLGDPFTGAELAAGMIRYRHGMGPVPEDAFLVDVLDTLSLAWLPAHPVRVRIFTELRVEVLEEQPVRCAGEANGQLLVQARNGLAPWEYRMYPSGDWRSDSLFTGLSADTYRFEVRDAHGFTALSEPFALSDPDSLLLSGQQTGDDQALLTAEGGRPPYRYRREEEPWQDDPWFGGLAQGLHTFTVQDQSGCTAMFTMDIQVSAVQGTGGISGLIVYPNPVRDWLHIRLDSVESGPFQWWLGDVLGRAVVQGIGLENSWSIATADLPAGLYLLEIRGRSGYARVPVLLIPGR